MSETILGGDWTIYHKIDNNQQRLGWTGAAGDERTVKETYLALQTAFDAQDNMKAGEPMSAQTPTEFTVGQIDQFDPLPWFIDRESAEHFTGGALQTANWTRVDGTYAGLVKVAATNTDIVIGDVGNTITHADLDSGVLVGFKDGGGAGELELWIRPDSEAAANNWDSTSGTITCNGHTAAQTAAAVKGESLWSGVFTQGGLLGASVGSINQGEKSHIYVYQDGSRLVSHQSTDTDYWTEDGHIDHLFLVKEADSLIDEGYITVFNRQYGATFSYWTVDLSGGGRNAVPIGNNNDLNVSEGYRTNTGSGGSNTFDVGSEILGGTSGARGILTAVGGTVGAPILQYFLIGEPQDDFTNGETITEVGGDASCTSGTPGADGPPQDVTGVTVTHANDNTLDVDEDGTNEYFSVVIDCNSYTLAEVYQYLMYELHRGRTGTTLTDGIAAESYIGIEVRLDYSAGSLTGTVSEGATVTGATSGATGVVVAHHLTPEQMTLRSVRGTFSSGETVEVDGSNYVTSVTPVTIAPNVAAPFGTFAGGFWFLQPGYVVKNYDSADENNWNTTDDLGATKAKPNKVTVAITNTRVDDWIALFKLTAAGGVIDDDEYSISGTPAIGSTSLTVGTSIAAEKPAAGKLAVRDDAAGTEHWYRYSSWTGSTFTLWGVASTTMDATSDEYTIVDTGAFANTQVGDIIYNSTRTAYAYVKSVDSNDQVTLDRNITNQTTGDSYTQGYTVAAYDSSDYLWVAFLMVNEDTGTDGAPGSESTTVTYSVDIPVLLRVRNADNATYKIKNFAVELTIENSGLSQGVIRTPETIAA